MLTVLVLRVEVACDCVVELVDEPCEGLWEAVEVGAQAFDKEYCDRVQLVHYFLSVLKCLHFVFFRVWLTKSKSVYYIELDVQMKCRCLKGFFG